MSKYHIALITDDNYCLPTLVCIKSIINHCSESYNYIIHVCTLGLEEANITKLQELSTANVSVVVDLFNGGLYEEKTKYISQQTHVTPTALIKFELPNYYSCLDKLLYLDGDIIIKDNIDELLKLDISNYYVAASYEFWAYLTAIRYTFRRKFSFYFNSGVMLLNLKKMRDNNIPDLLWDYKLHQTKTKLMDQESLNAVCGKDAYPLPIKWNFNPVFLDHQYLPHINRIYGSGYGTLKDLENDVSIIHYVGKSDKPWIYRNALLRKYWVACYISLKDVEQINLVDYIPPKRTAIAKLIAKIKQYGFIGTFLFFMFRLKNCISNNHKR